VTESLPGGHEWASDLDDRREVPILASFLMFGLRGPRAQGPEPSSYTGNSGHTHGSATIDRKGQEGLKVANSRSGTRGAAM
jgi:hypothetical protein